MLTILIISALLFVAIIGIRSLIDQPQPLNFGLPLEFEVELKARHFFGNSFDNSQYCPLAVATREALTLPIGILVAAGTFESCIHDSSYMHDLYGVHEYNVDRTQAESLKYNDTVIRTIKFKQYE